MQKAKVSVVECEDYNDVGPALRKCVDLLGGMSSFVAKGDTVLIKPNLSDPLPAEKAATTHPLILRSIIELVREAGGNPLVGELAAGDMPNRTREVFVAAGIEQLCKETKTPLINFQEGNFVAKDIPGHKVLERTDFAEAVLRVNSIINVPKLKTHGITYITGAVKNFFGCIHPQERVYVHQFSKEDFSKALVDIFSLLRPKVVLNIVDAVIAMEGDEGPAYGNPRKLGYLIASSDAVAADAVSAKLVDHAPLAIITTKDATQRGLGCGTLQDMTMVGDKLRTVKDFQHHVHYKNRFEGYKGEGFWLQPRIGAACQKCGACASSCPANAISLRDNYLIDESKCIKCYCCLEVCVHGAVELDKQSARGRPRLDGHYIVKLNSRCNSNCCFCADSNEVRANPDFDWNRLIGGLEENRKRFDSLIISGGEPTIYPRLMDYVRHAKNVCRYNRISLTTNGFLLAYGDFAEKLKSSGIDSFTISFITADSKAYDAVTRVQGSFQHVVKALSNIRKNNREFNVNMVLHKYNYRNIKETISFLVSNGVGIIQLSFMNPIGPSVRNGKSTVALSYSEVMPFVREAFIFANDINFDRLYVENIPLCIADEFGDRISDLRKPSANKDYYNACKTKPDKCAKCMHFDVCDGVWRDYLEQFGQDELKPIDITVETHRESGLLASQRTAKSLPYTSNHLHPWYFEWAGLDSGFKKVAIFYLKKHEIDRFRETVQEKGYVSEVADFVLNTRTFNTERSCTDIDEDSYFSVYVSREKELSKRFKHLDRCNQLSEKDPSGMSDGERYLEIGELLGYPRCCSEFLQSIHNSPDFEEDLRHRGKLFDYETLYPMAALLKSKRVHHLLNNFSVGTRLVGFYVCDYECPKALGIATQVLEYLKENNVQWQPLLEDLKKPVIFFSPREFIYPIDPRRNKDRVYYSDCLYSAAFSNEEAQQPLQRVHAKFLKGDSFSVTEREIRIYKNDQEMFTIQKKHPYDGVYIEFI